VHRAVIFVIAPLSCYYHYHYLSADVWAASEGL